MKHTVRKKYFIPKSWWSFSIWKKNLEKNKNTKTILVWKVTEQKFRSMTSQFQQTAYFDYLQYFSNASK